MEEPMHAKGGPINGNPNAPPLTAEEVSLLTLGRDCTQTVLEYTAKGKHIYSTDPKVVADVNRIGKRFLAVLNAMLSAAAKASANGAR
jgi:hypothetical protein